MARFWLLLTALLFAVSGHAQTTSNSGDLDALKFEQLMNVQVTTASKRPQSLQDVPAAVYVITQEDIHRSGVRSIPELLRMVPGLQVGKGTNNTWRVTARGFAGQYSDKLLVLVDGRSVYTHLFSGVFWETLDIPLEDIDRIEVVRGPGGALWGANAVNGVINIITKRASETQGSLLSSNVQPLSDGNSGSGIYQVGSKLKSGFYRAYVKGTSLHSADTVDRDSANDFTASGSGGFRADWRVSDSQNVSLFGNFLNQHEGERIVVPQLTPPFIHEEPFDFGSKTWSLQANWDKQGAKGNESIQAYAQGQTRDMPETSESERVLDISWQKETDSSRAKTIFGADLRSNRLNEANGLTVQFNPKEATTNLASAFVHHEIQLSRETRLEVGTKLESASDTGLQILPSVRILQHHGKDTTYWASASRAVRSPGAADDQGSSIWLSTQQDPTTGLPVTVVIHGSSNFKPETVLAYEAGMRKRLSDQASLDLAVYYNAYNDLRTFNQGQPFFSPTPIPHIEEPVAFGNAMHGSTAGFEGSLRYQPAANWRTVANLTVFSERLRESAAANDITPLYGADGRGETPRYQMSFSSFYSPSRTVDFDTQLVWNDHEIAGGIAGYWLANMRFGWHPRADFEVSLSVDNLFRDRSPQAGRELFDEVTLPERTLDFGLTLKF